MADNNSDRQNRFIKGTVGKQGFIRTSASAFKQISTKAESVIFSPNDDSVATSITMATITAAKTAVKVAYKTAYVTHKTNYELGTKVVNGVVGGVRFVKNPVMSDGQTYRKHLQTRVVRQVKNLKPVRAFTITKNGVKTATNAVGKTYHVSKALVKGDIKVTKELVAYTGIKTAKLVGKGTVSLAKSSGKSALYGLKTGVKFIPKTADAVGSALNSTGNEYLSAVGTSIKVTELATRTGIKTAQAAVSKTSSAVKTGYKGAKQIATGARYVRQHGVKQGAKQLGKRAVNKAEKTAVSLVKNLFSFIGKVLAAPTAIVVIVLLIGAGSTIAAVVGSAVNVVMGKTTDIVLATEEDNVSQSEKHKSSLKSVSEDEWLIERIKKTKAKKVEEIKEIMEKDLVKNGGEYHEIRFYNGFTDICIPLENEKDSTIKRTLYSDEQLYELIQPIFHNILMVKYNLKPTEEDMEKLYEDMVSDMMTIKSAKNASEDEENEWVEFCGDETHYPIDVSESEAKDAHTDCHIDHNSGCHRVLAMDDCLNVEKGFHANDEFVNGGGCEICCYDYYTCVGHQGELNCSIFPHQHGCSIDTANNYFRTHIEDGTVFNTVYYGWECMNLRQSGGRWSWSIGCEHGYGSDCHGHEHIEWRDSTSPGCYSTKYHCDPNDPTIFSSSNPKVEIKDWICEGAEHHSKCNGYRYCKGHKIEKVYFKSVDIDYLIDKYYNDEIEKLTLKKEENSATDEDLKVLSRYVENKKIVEEMINNTSNLYGSADKEIDPKEIENISISEIHTSIAYGCVLNKVPYVVGGNDIGEGVDDIGLICGVYNDMSWEHEYNSIANGVTLLPCGQDKKSDIKQGDIVFYSYDDSIDSIYHVGIALDDRFMIHASNTGTVRVSKIYKAAVHMIGRVS